MEVKIKTEESEMSLLRSVEEMKKDVASLLSGSPLPMTSCKSTSIQVKYNPRKSDIKEAELSITLGKTQNLNLN